MEEYGDEVFQKLADGAHIYFCGLKGMMPGILNMLEGVAEKKKLNWEKTLKDLKEKGKCTVHDMMGLFFFAFMSIHPPFFAADVGGVHHVHTDETGFVPVLFFFATLAVGQLFLCDCARNSEKQAAFGHNR